MANTSIWFAGPCTNVPKPDGIVTLEEVAERLTASPDSRSSPLTGTAHSQLITCHCLPKYAHVLCQLQTIEKRQSPVQADTLLTCIKLALGKTEDHPRCNQCSFDSRVLVQIIMIFQTIFSWAQSQTCSSSDKLTQPNISLGRHELTQDEVNFVMGALVARALNGIVSALKAIAARVEYAASRITKSASSSPDGEEYEDLQRLVNSLIRRYQSLLKKLVSTYQEIEQWRLNDATEIK